MHTESLVSKHARRTLLGRDPEHIPQPVLAPPLARTSSLRTAPTTGVQFMSQPLARASRQEIPPLVGDRTVQGPEEVRAHLTGTLKHDAPECFDGTEIGRAHV